MTGSGFSHPLVLLALLPLAVLTVLAARRLPGAEGNRRRRSSALQALAPLLLIVALAGPHVRTGSSRPTVLALDESASIDASERAAEGRWSARAGEDDCISPCRVIRFAQRSAASAARAHPGGLGPGATNVQQALSAAIGSVPPGGRVAVLSDGAQTEGDLLAAAPLARARDVEVDWVSLSGGGRRDAALSAIAAPPAVHLGDPVPVQLTVSSTVAAPATLTVSAGGARAQSRVIALRAGENPLLLLYRATARGPQSFQATISLSGDTDPANDSLGAVTDVLAAPRVLSVGGAHTAVPGLLARAGLDVTQREPAALPLTAAGYSGEDAVVLDDVPAARLSRARIAALSGAVRTQGLGLVVLGGQHSFSLGGYAGSALQQLLPVSSLVPGNLQRRNLAVELVLDRSGSMAEDAGGVQKIAMVRAGAVQSAAFLRAHQDALGIVDFDIKPHLLVPLTTLTSAADERRVEKIVDGLQAEGGTDIALGLKEGLAQLQASSAQQRHMILLTDGISQPADYAPLIAQFRRDHISVATVALGSDADRSLLAQIARGTGGRAYVTDNARELPRIFVKETQLSAKPVRVTGRLQVRLASDSAVVRSLIGKRLPSLAGNVVVQLKTGAQADLVAGDTGSQLDPALAEWQVGAGRVVAWTPGLDSAWADGWPAQTALWDDAVRWTERGVTPPALTPSVLPGASSTMQIDLASAGAGALGVNAIVGTLSDAAGKARAIAFEPAGPALYDADVSSWPPGIYRFALHTVGSALATDAGEVAIGYPAEYSPVSARISPMAQLVEQTGGRIIPAREIGALESHEHSLWWLAALLALAAFCAGVAVRMLSRP